MFFVYILQCADSTYYVGCTSDVEKRVKQHNESKIGARYTRARRPVTLRYTEIYATRSDAMKREYEIKQWTRMKKEALFA